uniref:Uncharacterized protein n=1 Tax=Ananas comosus var. bracteatus TaxID=296719 RepID=A0A6V7NMH0_ANACO|nr:unnamed protein product [Ananas comosus var. bracteatus]
MLVDWVVENWQKGSILDTVDAGLGREYATEEAEMVLKLGLICSHPHPSARPSMRLVVQYLEGHAPLPELSPAYLCFTNLSLPHKEGCLWAEAGGQWTAGSQGEQCLLVDWVVENWRKGSILDTVDAGLGGEYAREEAEMVLKLGLMCSHPHPAARPSMRLVVQYMEGRAPLPQLSPAYLSCTNLSLPHDDCFDDYVISYPSSMPSCLRTEAGGATNGELAREQFLLVDWVTENWRKGSILDTVDAGLEGEYVREEAEMVLKLGLICLHPHAAARPSMRLVVQYLEGRIPLPQPSPASLSFTKLSLPHNVACGRRPVEELAVGPQGEQLMLVDWVIENWREGSILDTVDAGLGGEYAREEAEMVLKLGLMCSHPHPEARPSMRLVVQYLEGRAALPELSPDYLYFRNLSLGYNEGSESLKGVATGLLYLHDEWQQVVGGWGSILDTGDAGLGGGYATEEAEMALKLELTCSHPHPHRHPSARPSMQLAVQYLEGRVPLPELSPA